MSVLKVSQRFQTVLLVCNFILRIVEFHGIMDEQPDLHWQIPLIIELTLDCFVLLQIIFVKCVFYACCNHEDQENQSVGKCFFIINIILVFLSLIAIVLRIIDLIFLKTETLWHILFGVDFTVDVIILIYVIGYTIKKKRDSNDN